MENPFLDRPPTLNSPYECTKRHREFHDQGQPTEQYGRQSSQGRVHDSNPQALKPETSAAQQSVVFAEGKELSTTEQQHDTTSNTNELWRRVDQWNAPPNSSDWQITPETARLLQRWKHQKFSGIRPFFCQVEAVGTAIWLMEVAPNAGRVGKAFHDHLRAPPRRAEQ